MAWSGEEDAILIRMFRDEGEDSVAIAAVMLRSFQAVEKRISELGLDQSPDRPAAPAPAQPRAKPGRKRQPKAKPARKAPAVSPDPAPPWAVFAPMGPQVEPFAAFAQAALRNLVSALALSVEDLEPPMPTPARPSPSVRIVGHRVGPPAAALRALRRQALKPKAPAARPQAKPERARIRKVAPGLAFSMLAAATAELQATEKSVRNLLVSLRIERDRGRSRERERSVSALAGRLLAALARHGPLTVRELADTCSLSPEAVGRTARVLEQGGRVVFTVEGAAGEPLIRLKPDQSIAGGADA